MSSRFPKAYDGDARRDDSMMEYAPMDKMGIGARPSALPKGSVSDIKSLEHVGKEARGEAKRAK